MSSSLNNIYEINEVGSDYVVGDIHGCFERLQQELDKVGFNPETDRLFSVGDLVDRGPDSEASLEWLAKPWFHAVRGNHEQMAIDALDGFYEPANYAFNGGAWFMSLPKEHQREFVNAFKAMPLWISVSVKDGLVGIVHGDGPTDWEHVDKLHEHHLLWGRARIMRKDETPVANVLKVYSGHTPVKKKQVYGNTHFIDTGAVFGGSFHLEKFN